MEIVENNWTKALMGSIWKASWKVLKGSTTIAGSLNGWRKNSWTVTFIEHTDAWQAVQMISIWTSGQAISIPG